MSRFHLAPFVLGFKMTMQYTRKILVQNIVIYDIPFVEMVHINVQKFHLGGTPRKVLYHNVSRSVVSFFKPEPGETGKCMELVILKEQLSSSSPDDASCDGIKLEDTEAWQLRLACSIKWPGMVLAICPYLDHILLLGSCW
ncbi:hypothetical protein Dsin_007183 [Dipteronia sinensis]|uniref:Uncharacterized protein n=1 Tax=Dipteronia sinensis TaxID=43782 RepID=A0AAE0AZR0_9ROSI|nr:hypothetical protein Dsin_007183 [Dipteronia sinensis]